MLTIFMANMLILIISSLVGMAFITLMERKILGLMQIRLGPNKTSQQGILQPMSDAIKLYTKELNNPKNSNVVMFYLLPSLSIMLSMIIWMVTPYLKSMMFLNKSMILLLCILSMSVYITLMLGWSSNSVFSSLGSIRSVAQTISYEVSLSFILINIFILSNSLNFYNIMLMQTYTKNILFLPIVIMWLVSCLAELNRTPFDFSEAESELVSGFNTEFSGGKFALIFMAEYMMIIFLSNLTVMLFLSSSYMNMTYFLYSTFISFFIIWSRSTLPRLRYDKLMSMAWKWILPTSILLVMLFFSINFVSVML